jgi:hypothetical protein
MVFKSEQNMGGNSWIIEEDFANMPAGNSQGSGHPQLPLCVLKSHLPDRLVMKECGKW